MPYGFSFATSAQQVFSKFKSKKKDRSNTFTLRQGFFIVAGGLAVETKSFHKEQYMTITPAGAVELGRLGLLTPVPEDVIDDKTKADLITKLLVFMQAGWFIIQCTARVAKHLPLSLLEIHVLTHVFVALLMYLFWFAKPYDALSPVVVTEPWVVEAVALFMLAQRDERAGGIEMTNQATERCVLIDGPPTISHFTTDRQGYHRRTVLEVLQLAVQRLKSFNMHLDPSLPAPIDRQGHHTSTALDLAQLAVQRLKSLNIHLKYFMIDETDIQFCSTYVVHAIHDFTSTPSFSSSRTIFFSETRSFEFAPNNPIYLLALICFVPYGALHLSAWNAHFPTLVERSLWRAAGLSIVGGPTLMECSARFCSILNWVLDLNLTESEWVPSALDFVILFPMWLSSVCVMLSYPIMAASRLYFLVEAFLSLRDPAPRMYETVTWTHFWPHF